MTGSTPGTGRIVVVGSLNADLVVRTHRFPAGGETVEGGDLQILPGGKSANQAVCAARLGGRVALVGAVGADANGRLLRDSVAAAGVDVSAVGVLDGVATGSAVITVDDAGENTIVLSPGANGRLGADDLERVHAALDQAAVLVVCLEVDTDVVLAAVRAAAQRGVTVVTNLSPFKAVPGELVTLSDVLLLNEHEAAQLTGLSTVRPADAGELSAALAGLGVHRAVVTLGGAGCLVVDRGATTAVDAVRIDPVDTTGCGDAFTGTVALHLAAGNDLLTAAREAVAVSAFAATRSGAQPSYPTIAELADFRAARAQPPG